MYNEQTKCHMSGFDDANKRLRLTLEASDAERAERQMIERESEARMAEERRRENERQEELARQSIARRAQAAEREAQAAQEAANRAAHQEARRAAQQAAQQAADARRYADVNVPFLLPLTNYPLLTFGRLENGGLRITGVSPADHPMLSVGMHLINIEGTNVAYASIEDIIDPILGKLTRDRAGTREPVILTFAQARREVEVNAADLEIDLDFTITNTLAANQTMAQAAGVFDQLQATGNVFDMEDARDLLSAFLNESLVSVLLQSNNLPKTVYRALVEDGIMNSNYIISNYNRTTKNIVLVHRAAPHAVRLGYLVVPDREVEYNRELARIQQAPPGVNDPSIGMLHAIDGFDPDDFLAVGSGHVLRSTNIISWEAIPWNNEIPYEEGHDMSYTTPGMAHVDDRYRRLIDAYNLRRQLKQFQALGLGQSTLSQRINVMRAITNAFDRMTDPDRFVCLGWTQFYTQAPLMTMTTAQEPVLFGSDKCAITTSRANMEYFQTFSTCTFLNEFKQLAESISVEGRHPGNEGYLEPHENNAITNLQARLGQFGYVPAAAHAIAISLVNLNANALPKVMTRDDARMLLLVIGIQHPEQLLPQEDDTNDYWKDVSAILTNNGVCFRDWASDAFVAVGGLVDHVFHVLRAGNDRHSILSHVMPLRVPHQHAQLTVQEIQTMSQAVGSTVLNHILFYNALGQTQYPEFARTLATGSTRDLLKRTASLGHPRDMNAIYASHAGTNHPLASLVNVLSSINPKPRGYPFYLIGHEAILCKGGMVPPGYIKLSEYEALHAARVDVLRKFFAEAHRYFTLYTAKGSKYTRAPRNTFDSSSTYDTAQMPIAWKVNDHMNTLSGNNIINNFVTYARTKGVVVVSKDMEQFYVRCTFDNAFDDAIRQKTAEYATKTAVEKALFTSGNVNISSSMQAIDSVFFEIATACEDLNIVKLMFDMKIPGGQCHKIGLQYFTKNRANYATRMSRYSSTGVFWNATFNSFEIFPSASLLPDIGILDTYMCHTNSYITTVNHGLLANVVQDTAYEIRSIPDPSDVTTTDPPKQTLTELGLAYPTFMTKIRETWMRRQRWHIPNQLIPAEPQGPAHTMISQYIDGFIWVASRMGDPNVQNNVLHFFMTRYMELP